MGHAHKWEDLFPEEFFEELNRVPIVYWGCGAMEEHGLHSALGGDCYHAYEICRRAVEATGGIVFPPVPLAPAGVPGRSREELRSGEHKLYPPSLWVSREVCGRVYLELMESFADMGFKACVAFGGHWPADKLLQAIEEKHGAVIRGMRFWGGGTIRIMRDWLDQEARKDPAISAHGGMWETSLVMAFRPDWVKPERAARIKASPLPSQLKGLSDEKITRIAQANPEYGERSLAFAAERLAEVARGLLPDSAAPGA